MYSFRLPRRVRSRFATPVVTVLGSHTRGSISPLPPQTERLLTNTVALGISHHCCDTLIIIKQKLNQIENIENMGYYFVSLKREVFSRVSVEGPVLTVWFINMMI